MSPIVGRLGGATGAPKQLHAIEAGDRHGAGDPFPKLQGAIVLAPGHLEREGRLGCIAGLERCLERSLVVARRRPVVGEFGPASCVAADDIGGSSGECLRQPPMDGATLTGQQILVHGLP